MIGGYDPDRYAPTSVAVLLQLPESSARAFAVASALGRILDLQGTSERVRNGKEASGTRIDRYRLPDVLEALAISDRQWRRYIAGWERDYTAHRCGGGRVFLFAKSLPETCAECGTEIVYDHAPSSPRRKRGAGFAGNGRTTATQADALRPKSGAGTSASPAQERPHTRTDATHHETGINGMEVGVPGLEEQEALARVQEALGAVIEKTAPPEMNNLVARQIAVQLEQEVPVDAA